MSLNFIRKRAYEKNLLKHRDMKPEQMYKKSVAAIQEISMTEGFKEVIAYWQREVNMHDNELESIDPRKDAVHAAIVLDRRKTANKFLTFLENLALAQK